MPTGIQGAEINAYFCSKDLPVFFDRRMAKNRKPMALVFVDLKRTTESGSLQYFEVLMLNDC